MSITANSVDEYKAKDEVKKCPKIVRDYVKALNSVIGIIEGTRAKAVSKVISQAKRIEDLKALITEINITCSNMVIPTEQIINRMADKTKAMLENSP